MSRDLVLGLLPSIRGGLGELAKTGQHSRLIDGYLRPYAEAFREVRYFSYLRESLDRYTSDAAVLERVRLFSGGALHPWLYSLVMPLRYRRELSGCSVLRVFQITGVIPALAAKRLYGVPFVTTYGFWYSKLPRSRATGWLRRVVERVGLAAADGVIVTTPELGRHVAGRVGSDKVHLIPNGVDTRLFRPSLRPAGGPKTVLYVGRLSEEKNLSLLVEAAAKLAGRVSLRLVFIGGGSLRSALETRARELRVPAEFIPLVNHRELPGYFGRADAFVLPSFTEGHPKVLLEAMSCGVACVASDVEGNRAVLSDAETGLLFDPRDPGALADRLERVFTDADLARGMGERARARIVESYDLGVLIGGEIELLSRVARGA